MATRSDDFLQRALQALGPSGKQFDHFQDPTTYRRGGDVVAARHVGKPLVMAENCEDDRGDLPGRQLVPPGADLLQMAAEQVAEEGQGGRGQLQTGLVDNRLSVPGGAGFLWHDLSTAAGGIGVTARAVCRCWTTLTAWW
ncbi:hypothetical protein ACWGJB_40195 [Streptomyces sp. NPDC054813]